MGSGRLDIRLLPFALALLQTTAEFFSLYVLLDGWKKWPQRNKCKKRAQQYSLETKIELFVKSSLVNG